MGTYRLNSKQSILPVHKKWETEELWREREQEPKADPEGKEDTGWTSAAVQTPHSTTAKIFCLNRLPIGMKIQLKTQQTYSLRQQVCHLLLPTLARRLNLKVYIEI